MRKSIRNSTGNTIITVLVATAISTVIALALATTLTNALQTQRGVTQTVDAEQAAALVALALSKESICSQALLKDENGTLISARTVRALGRGISLRELRTAPGAGGSGTLVERASKAECERGTIPKGKESLCSGVLLSRIEILPRRDVAGADISRVASDFYLAELKMTFEKTGQTLGAQTISRSIPVALTVDAVTGQMQGCRASSSESQPKRRCAPSVYEDRPWIREKIFCRTSEGGTAILYYSSDDVPAAKNKLIYSSPHGKSPMTITFDLATGDFQNHMWSDAGDGESCLNKNLKDIVNDAENRCQD